MSNMLCCCVLAATSFSRHLNLHASPMEDENDQNLVDFLVDQGNNPVRTQKCYTSNTRRFFMPLPNRAEALSDAFV